MSLQVWLPLNGDLHNQGLRNIEIRSNNIVFDSTGKIGQCATFNGSNSYIYIPNFELGNEWSYGCWININSSESRTWNLIIILNNSGSDADSQLAFWVHQSQNRFETLANTQYNSQVSYANYYGNWHHFFATYNGTLLTTYMDGIVVNTKTVTHEQYTGTNLTIGARATNVNGTSFTQYLQGSLNDVRVYDHCLSKKEVEEISKGLVLHYKLDTLDLYGSGNPNLATCSTAEQRLTAASNNNYCYFWINSSTLEPNTTYTFSAEVEVSDDITKCTIYNYTSSGNSGSIYHNFPADGQRHSWTFTTTSTGLGLIGYAGNSGQTAGHSAIYRNIKIELGSVATPYIPRENEMGETNFNTTYDCSGYNHIGLINNVSAINDTQRYGKSMSFSGSTSYVKVNDNTWMAQHAKAMTINLWVKNSSWATNTHFFSCTESGGFNTEPGNSGYLRFPIYVCTNAEQTSYAYKYDSKELQISAIPTNEWVMLTWVYDNTGTRTYINGQLHHTYTNTSYGIRFNMNARLFLGCEASTANPTTPYYNGQESDFRLYYTALTQEQILELYNTSMTIDKNGNGYVREVIEDMGLNVTKTGQFHGYEMLDDNTFTTASITKLNKQLKVNTLYEY